MIWIENTSGKKIQVEKCVTGAKVLCNYKVLMIEGS